MGYENRFSLKIEGKLEKTIKTCCGSEKNGNFCEDCGKQKKLKLKN